MGIPSESWTEPDRRSSGDDSTVHLRGLRVVRARSGLGRRGLPSGPMEFRILGPVEVSGPGGPIRLGSRRERAVLAALVIGGGTVVSAERLIDALWAGEPPRSAAKTLQNYVLKLRKALGAPVIETQAPGYRLASAGDCIDARRF